MNATYLVKKSTKKKGGGFVNAPSADMLCFTMHKKNGNTLVEALMVISIVGLMVANLGTISSNTISKAKWSQANNLQYQVNKTYSNWVQLGGTHELPFPDSIELPITGSYVSSRGASSSTYSVNGIVPSTRWNGRALVTVTSTITSVGESARYYLRGEGGSGAETNTIIGPSTVGSVITQKIHAAVGEPITLSEVTFRNGGWRDESSRQEIAMVMLEVPEPQNNLTEEMWLMLNSPSGLPYKGILPDAGVVDSTGNINSSSIRLGSVGNAEVETSDGGIVYNEDFLLEFTSTSNNSGFWIVSYIR